MRFTFSTRRCPRVFVESLDSRIPADTEILVHYGGNYSNVNLSKKGPGRPPRKSGRKGTIFSVKKEGQPHHHTRMRNRLL